MLETLAPAEAQARSLGTDIGLHDHLGKLITNISYDPGMLATLLALDTLPPGKLIAVADLRDRTDELRGAQPQKQALNWDGPPSSYFKNALLKATGVVEVGATTVEGTNLPAKGVRFTEIGRISVPQVCGALLNIELTSDKPVLPVLLLPPNKSDGRERTRMKVYRELTTKPAGVNIANLSEACGLTSNRTSNVVGSMVEAGILEAVDLAGPSAQRFRLNKACGDEIRPDLRRLPLSNATLEVLQTLWREGRREMSGDELIQAVLERHPEASRASVWNYILRRQANAERLSALRAEVGEASWQKLVRIADTWKSAVGRLVETQRLLTDPGKEGDDFREWATARSKEIAASKTDMDRLLPVFTGRKSERAPKTKQKPEADTPIDVLDEEDETDATSKPKATQQRPSKIVEVAIALPGQPVHFPHKWRDDANCYDMSNKVGAGKFDEPNYQDEPFFPIGTTGPAAAEAERAKAVCRPCRVSLACLKTALRTGVTEGVWGGVWLDQVDEELPLPARKQVLTMVQIGPAQSQINSGYSQLDRKFRTSTVTSDRILQKQRYFAILSLRRATSQSSRHSLQSNNSRRVKQL